MPQKSIRHAGGSGLHMSKDSIRTPVQWNKLISNPTVTELGHKQPGRQQASGLTLRIEIIRQTFDYLEVQKANDTRPEFCVPWKTSQYSQSV